MPDTSKLAEALPADALKDAGQRLLSLMVQKAAEAATDRVTNLTDRLDTVTENGGSGVREALGRGRGRDDDEDRDPDDEDGDEDEDGKKGGFFSGIKEKVSGLFGGGGDDSEGGGGGSGGGKKVKLINIVEEQDVGLPLRTTYNLWTQMADFPGFMKKVESVDQLSDEKTHWKAQVFLSHREWEATIMDQVADSHIMWRSKGAKGHVDGAVSFTGLGPNLTRILLVLEYHPQGLFERTGNIWRAQGRRARLEFKHFRRHAMTTALLHQDEIEGWRGEIRDGEVVKTHEEALDEERSAREEEGEPEERDEYAEGAEPDEDAEYEEEAEPAAEYDEDYDEEPAEETDEGPVDESEEYADEEPDEEYEEADEYADEEPDEEPDEEYEEADEAEPAADEDTEPDEEPDEEPPPARRRTARRQTAGAGGRSR